MRSEIKWREILWNYELISVHKTYYLEVLELVLLDNGDFICLLVISSPPSAAYMRQSIAWALLQIMACRLFGAKPLSKPVLVIINWTPRNELQWNFNQNLKFFIEENAFEIVVCQNGGHFPRPQCVKINWGVNKVANWWGFVDNIPKCVFWKNTICIWTQISPIFVPRGPIGNRSTLVSGNDLALTSMKRLFESILTSEVIRGQQATMNWYDQLDEAILMCWSLGLVAHFSINKTSYCKVLWSLRTTRLLV